MKDRRYVVRPGRTTDEAGSIILNFLKFTYQILGSPSERWITVINMRQNKSADGSFQSIMGEIVAERTDLTELEIVNLICTGYMLLEKESLIKSDTFINKCYIFFDGYKFKNSPPLNSPWAKCIWFMSKTKSDLSWFNSFAMVIHSCFQELSIGLIAPSIKNQTGPGKSLRFPSRFFLKGIVFFFLFHFFIFF